MSTPSEQGEADAAAVQATCKEVLAEFDEEEEPFTSTEMLEGQQRALPALTVGADCAVDHRLLDLLEALVARQLLCHPAVSTR